MSRLINVASRAADLSMAIPLLLGSPFIFTMGRWGHRLLLSRRILDCLGIAIIRRHYHTPIIDARDLHRALDEERDLPGLNMNASGQLSLLEQLRYTEELRRLPLEQPTKGRFGYHNGSFESGDVEILYSMIRHFKPRRIVEVGSGNSTLVVREALHALRQKDSSYECDHVCIEPYEQPWLESTGARVIRERVELIKDDVFERLAAGDILFVDSSHVIRPQGDVVHEYLYILGRLNAGVIVHVHDILTPRDYPETWVLDRRQLWNEQYLLEAFLSFNDQFEVLAAVNWLKHNHFEELAAAAPIFAQEPEREPGSFWFRRKLQS